MAIINLTPGLARNDAASALEDTTTNGNVLSNDLLLGSVAAIRFGTSSLNVPSRGSQTLAGNFGTLTISSNGQYAYNPYDSLREGQTGTDTFTYTGILLGLLPGLPLAGSNGNLVFNVTGVNDLSTIQDVVSPAGVSELAGDSSAQNIAPLAGSLTISDLDVGDTLSARVVGTAIVALDGNPNFALPAGAAAVANADALTFGGATTNGGAVTLAYTYDPATAALDFLREGQTLTATYAIVVNDGVADSSTQNVVVTITGTNDVPVLSALAAQPVAVAELGDASAQDLAPISGSFGVLDQDVGDTLTASQVGSAVVQFNGDTIASGFPAALTASGVFTLVNPGTSTGAAQTAGFTYDPGATNLDFLRASDTLTVSYDVKLNDGLADSGTQNVTFSIQGSNDAAVIGNPDAASVTEDAAVVAGNLLAGGNISISDLDRDEAFFQTTVVSGTDNLGSLNLEANGSYTYSVANSAVQFLGADQTQTDSFTVSALDGTTKAVSFTVTGVNDPAVIGDPSVPSVTEDVSVVAGNLVASGSIPISDVDQNQASFQTTVAPAANNLGSLVLATDGNYSYTVTNSAVQLLGAGQTQTDSFTVTALDGTTKLVSFTITGVNDAAVIGAANNSTVTEDVNAVAGNLVASGSIPITDADQNQASFQTTVTPAANNLGSLVLATDGNYSYTVANSAVQLLGAGQTQTDSFTVTALDGTTKVINFTVNGANDAAVIGAANNNTVTEDVNVVAGNLVASGNIPISDVDQNQASFQTTVMPGTGNLGSLVLATDGNYSYKVANSAVQLLGAGQTRTDSFTVTALDGTAKVINFTVNGANDAAVIGNANNNTVTEDVNAVAGNLVASGNIPITDADQNQASFQTTVTPGTGNLGSLVLATDGNYSYTVANSAVQLLGTGQTRTDSFTVTALDGTAKVINFTVNGANDAAVIGNANNNTVTEDVNAVAGNLVASGNIPITDADQNQASFQTTVTPGTGNLGSLNLAADGNYTYSVSNAAVQFLNNGETRVDSFTVSALDGASRLVNFTIHGANDNTAPTVQNITSPAAISEQILPGPPQNIAALTGLITAQDLDLSGTLSASVVSTTVQLNGSAYTLSPASLPLTTPAALSFGTATSNGGNVSLGYTYDPAAADLSFLNTGDVLTLTYEIRVNDGTANSTNTRNIVITINGTNNVLNGGPGNDALNGGNGIDTISGNDGIDDIAGGRGNDIIFGGAGYDLVSANLATDGADQVDLGKTADVDVAGLFASNGGQIRVTLNPADVGNGNTLDGNNAANEDGGLAMRVQLEDTSGNLIGLESRYEDESISIQRGTYDVRDLVSGTQFGEFNVLFLLNSDVQGGLSSDFSEYIHCAGGNDLFNSAGGNDYLDGGVGNDTLFAGMGNDTVEGDAGTDYISGQGGSDRILLGTDGEHDVVLYVAGDSNPTGFDTITGYEKTFDRIDVEDGFVLAVGFDGDGDGLREVASENALIDHLIGLDGESLTLSGATASAVIAYETGSGTSYFFWDANGNGTFDTAGPDAADVFVKIAGVQIDPAMTFF